MRNMPIMHHACREHPYTVGTYTRKLNYNKGVLYRRMILITCNYLVWLKHANASTTGCLLQDKNAKWMRQCMARSRYWFPIGSMQQANLIPASGEELLTDCHPVRRENPWRMPERGAKGGSPAEQNTRIRAVNNDDNSMVEKGLLHVCT